MPAAGCRGRHDPQVPGTGEEYHRIPHGTFRNHGVSGRSEPDQRGRLTGRRASGRRQDRRDADRPRVGYRRSAALHPFHVRRRRFSLYQQSDLVGRNVELSDEERLFVRRRSHLDFLLYNRMDNTPILGIEVDGVLHHRFDEVQVARDRHKNGILAKIGLPLLRLSTDGSSEKERIVGALEQAMQQG